MIQKFGDRAVFCFGDHEQGALNELMDVWWEPDIEDNLIVYSDPPWDSANYLMFRRITGSPEGMGWLGFVDYITGIYCRAQIAFIEMGRRNKDMFIEAMAIKGMKHLRSWDTTYYGDKPETCNLFAKERFDIDADLSGVDSEDLPDVALDVMLKLKPEWQGAWVFDPFAGYGYTAKAALKRGYRTAGIEFQSTKYNSLMRAAKRITGFDAEIIESGMIPEEDK